MFAKELNDAHVEVTVNAVLSKPGGSVQKRGKFAAPNPAA